MSLHKHYPYNVNFKATLFCGLVWLSWWERRLLVCVTGSSPALSVTFFNTISLVLYSFALRTGQSETNRIGKKRLYPFKNPPYSSTIHLSPSPLLFLESQSGRPRYLKPRTVSNQHIPSRRVPSLTITLHKDASPVFPYSHSSTGSVPFHLLRGVWSLCTVFSHQSSAGFWLVQCLVVMRRSGHRGLNIPPPADNIILIDFLTKLNGLLI